jgi:hypothetical protein
MECVACTARHNQLQTPQFLLSIRLWNHSQAAPKYLAVAESSVAASTASARRQQQQQQQQALAELGPAVMKNPSAHVNPLVVHMTKQAPRSAMHPPSLQG